MTTYKGIRGLTIRTVAGDTSPLLEGDIWYNSVSRKVKGAKTPAGAWSSGTDLNTARMFLGGVGPATNNLAFSGKPDGTATWLTVTEAYDGSAWTVVADMSGGQANFACGGSAESAIVAGGEPGRLANSEEWGGSSWTAGGDLNTARDTLNGFGASNTAALACGGQIPAVQVITETYDGSSWTEVGDLNLARGYAPGSSGTTTAALCFGGACDTPSPNVMTALTESWNGASWTEVNDLNTARKNGAGAGVQPSTLYAGGWSAPGTAALDVNELWNGTSWTESSELNTGRNGLGGTGNANTAVLVFGGNTGSETNKTEAWDGTSWTEVSDLAAPSEDFASSATGGPTAALRASGNVSGARSGATESWTAATYQIKTVTTS